MKITKKKVMLSLLLLSIFVIAQLPATCYATTYKDVSFTQAIGTSGVVYTKAFNPARGSVMIEVSEYLDDGQQFLDSDKVKVTLQTYSEGYGWRDSQTKNERNGRSMIFDNWEVNGTCRFKVEHYGRIAVAIAKVTYGVEQ